MADAGGSERKTVGLEELLRRHLPGPVRLLLFTSRQAPFAAEQRRLLEGLVRLSDRLSLEIHDLEDDAEAARRHGVDKAPCTIVSGGRGPGLRFYGLTGGHELSSLLEAMLMAGSSRSGLPPELEEWVRRIDAPAHVEVFVTLTCPICPKMVRLAHQMATVNDNVRAEMVEAAEFPEAARAHDLASVPLVVVNGRHAFHGLLLPEEAILEIMRVAVPGVFEELEAGLRAKAGASRVQPPGRSTATTRSSSGRGPRRSRPPCTRRAAGWTSSSSATASAGRSPTPRRWRTGWGPAASAATSWRCSSGPTWSTTPWRSSCTSGSPPWSATARVSSSASRTAPRTGAAPSSTARGSSTAPWGCPARPGSSGGA